MVKVVNADYEGMNVDINDVGNVVITAPENLEPEEESFGD